MSCKEEILIWIIHFLLIIIFVNKITISSLMYANFVFVSNLCKILLTNRALKQNVCYIKIDYLLKTTIKQFFSA